jgi:hypothetical protein
VITITDLRGDLTYESSIRAAKVMRKRPDIDISVCVANSEGQGRPPLTGHGWWCCDLQTRHNYEISYPYEWGEPVERTHGVPLSQRSGTANPICP